MNGRPAPEGRFALTPVLIVSAAVFGGFFARDAFRPMQETVRVSLGLSDTQLALLQGPAIAISIALGLIPLGLLIDRASRKRLLMLSLLLGASATAVLAGAFDFRQLLAGRFLVGIVSIAPLVIAASILPDIYPAAQRGRAFGIFSIFDNLGSASASIAGGAALAAASAYGLGWRAGLLAMIAPLVVLILIVAALREPPRHERDQSAAKGSLAELWKYRRQAAPLLAARIWIGVANVAALEWAAPLFQRSFLMTPERTGAIIGSIVLAAGLASSFFGALISDSTQLRGGPRLTARVLAGVSLLMLPAALFGLAPDGVWAGLGLGALLIAGYTISVSGLVLSTIVVPNEVRGLYTSITLALGNLCAVALAPLLVSMVSRSIGGDHALGSGIAITCSVAIIGAALSLWGGARWLPDRQPSYDGAPR